MEKKLQLIFDLGRSHNRLMDMQRKIVIIDDAKYKELDVNETVRKDIKDKYTDFIINGSAMNSLVGRRFVKGIGMSSVKGITTQADNQDLKVNQEDSFINFAYMTARYILEVVKAESTDLANCLDVEIGVCIPTAEYYSDQYKIMKEHLAGLYNIKFPVADKTVYFRVDIQDILVSPEGPVAMEPLRLYGPEEDADLIDEATGLIIDIGYGSADNTLVVAGEPQGDVARSFAYGGVTLRSAVASVLEREGFSATESNKTMAISRGEVLRGEERKPVGKFVQKCKERLARKAVDSAKDVVNEDFRQMDDISYIFTAGRNFAVNSKEDETRYVGSLADMIKDNWGRDVKVFTPYYRDEDKFKIINRTKVLRDGSYEELDEMTEELKYELANIYGLSIALSSDNDEDEETEEVSEGI